MPVGRNVGKVKWFDKKKGFGFITADDAGYQEYFVHYSSVVMEGFKALDEGQRVTFDTEDGPKGTSAVNVQVVRDYGFDDQYR